MRDEGRAVVFITHRLAEVFDVCDRIQVLQDGRSVQTFHTDATSGEEVVRAMLGREMTTIFPHRVARRRGRPLLEVENVGGSAPAASMSVKGITFTLHEGEILGLFGLVGAGRTELLNLLFGIDRCLPGSSVRVDGVEVAGKGPHEIFEAGMGFVTEDRKRTGLVLEMSVHANLLMASLDRLSWHGLVQSHRERGIVLQLIEALGIRTAGPDLPVRNLSGGNQQKVALGKWLSRHPKVLLLDEPTRGIDVGAKAEVFRILAELAAKGMAILLVSSEAAEIMSFCDRALVMYRGAVVSELQRQDLTEATLMQSATGLAA
jgi:ABC-type sugar transport system ATPase subunit